MKTIKNASIPATTTAARQSLFLEYLPLVNAVALRVFESLPVNIDLDDLIHAGIRGLFDATSKYSADQNVPFGSYAKYVIRKAILDSLRRLDCVSGDMRQPVGGIGRPLSSTLQHRRTDSELAETLGVTIERWRHIKDEARFPLVNLASRYTLQQLYTCVKQWVSQAVGFPTFHVDHNSVPSASVTKT
jgi:RNA polymerase sigma factor for flagellar operon FliA